MVVSILISCALSYLMGSLPFGVWAAKLLKGIDIQRIGSGNIGATNVTRVLGPGPGLAIFFLDAAKGAIGIMLARGFQPDLAMPVLILIGICAIMGHTFSIFLRFTGGKAVSTTVGVLFALHPLVAGIAVLLMIPIIAIWRYVSLAAIIAAISLPFIAFFAAYPHAGDRQWMMGLCIVVAIVIPVRHRENIQRLRTGTESRVGQPIDATKE